jgi:hypothetical protein
VLMSLSLAFFATAKLVAPPVSSFLPAWGYRAAAVVELLLAASLWSRFRVLGLFSGVALFGLGTLASLLFRGDCGCLGPWKLGREVHLLVGSILGAWFTCVLSFVSRKSRQDHALH